MNAHELQPVDYTAPGATFWDQDVADHSVEELAVISNDLWELSAAVHYMQQSGRVIKILSAPTEYVQSKAEVFRRIGVEGVVRDPMGLVVIPVSAAG